MKRYWYERDPWWFWHVAAAVTCFVLGHKKGDQYGDCDRCG